MNSNPFLSNILRHGVLLWFRGETYEPNRVPLRYRTLVCDQNAIGWNHLVRGRLAKEWHCHHDLHLATKTEHDPKQSGAQWAPSIVTHFLQQWLQLWKLSNNSRHGEDPEATAAALHAQVQRGLTQLFSFRTTVMPHDQDFLFTPLSPPIYWPIHPPQSFKTGCPRTALLSCQVQKKPHGLPCAASARLLLTTR